MDHHVILSPDQIFTGTIFREVNLNDELQGRFASFPRDPSGQQARVHSLGASGVTFGGWMDDRSWLWTGTYMDTWESIII